MNLGDEMQRVFRRISKSGNIALLLLWHVLHLILSVLYIIREIFYAVESYLITNGYVKTYTNLNLDRVKYLGLVVDSDEARKTSQVIELLEWLSAIGVKKVCLYDREGVLKKSKEVFVERFGSAELPNENSKTIPLLSKKRMDFEFVSITDGKEAVAKAANLLFKKYYVDADSEKPFFTETYLTEALRTLGAVEPDPDLLLIYGPARCLLGFPAWRIRYTEMVHMGPLKYKKYGLILKAIHRFTKVKQNFGS
ncbi:dehydrodolichyl diphosphate synthase complex subunit nus1-like isoform X1 [Cynara cardunculus var. scolymus]|uniref:dehydrodolichyl diphosphate synthase complex subunit nus1-like isoform X1 n=1 Tax=Cynara cardunculus var. scolymus TaxID=59895 RepID=UPI000D62FD4A|nr:dehydrodolichyl diphosphate synthase complex subunit nus1-like isoform X1 [Cynara cardunculus var. scolymus]